MNAYTLIRLFAVLVVILFLLPSTVVAESPVYRANFDPPPPDGHPTDRVDRPIPIPEWTPSLGITEDEHHMIRLDRETGEETTIILPIEDDTLDAQISEIDPDVLDMLAGEPAEPLDISNFSDLSEVSDPSLWPFRGHVKMYMTFPNTGSSQYGCSGVLVDESHVLTVAHCVFAWNDPDNGKFPCPSGGNPCWASSVEVVPGYADGNRPYGESNWANMYVWSGWSVNHNWDWDIALVYLQRPVGELTGYYGYGYNTDNSFFSDNTFDNPGYPIESPDFAGEDGMWTRFGSFDEFETDILYFHKDSFGGQSGSGLYHRFLDDSRVVYAVHSHDRWDAGIPGRESGNTRITSTKFTLIGDAIAADRPDTVDLIPLDVNVSPASIPAGGTISAMDYLIHNYSEATYSGTLTVYVYLSSDDDITSGDTFLGSHTVSPTITPRGSTRVTVTSPPSIPLATSGGTYYIGVILDSSDANTTNNDTDGWDADETTVISCPQPSKPTLLSPANGAVTNDTTPFFDWSASTNASDYLIWADNDCDWNSREIDTYTSNSYYTPGSLADGAYCWAVLARNTTSGCNVTSDWSDVFVVEVDDTEPNNPTSMWSTSHSIYSWLNDSTISMAWSGASDSGSGVQGYGVYWNESPDSIPGQVIDTYTEGYTSSPLADGSSWYFHLITVDDAGNWTTDAIHRGPYYIDTVDPSAWMTGLPASQTSTSIDLDWGGDDDRAGVDDYYVQYKIGDGGTWTSWLSATSSTEATFGPSSPVTVVVGESYYFQTAARDYAGNISDYPGGDGHTMTTIVDDGANIYLPIVIR